MSEGGIVGALARQIGAGECALSAWVGINDPAVAEQLARDGYDTVTLDMQHGAIDVVGAMRGIAAVGAGRQAGDRAHSRRRFFDRFARDRRRRRGGHRADDQ